jgi:carboxylesterase type B
MPASLLKPVSLQIHGGGFTEGTGNDPTFDGGNIASRGDVVLVNINYRLSTLGFLTLDDGVTNGNFAVSDMVAALDWVRAHITAFGGNPDRITLVGESAGADSVRFLLGSPRSIGKFSAAITMSKVTQTYESIAQVGSTTGSRILQLTGCNQSTNDASLACLRTFDAEKLVSLQTVAV